jgi:hypothetical protein
LAKLSFKQAVAGFEADVLVMNPDFERLNVPNALVELLQGIIVRIQLRNNNLSPHLCSSSNRVHWQITHRQSKLAPWKIANSTMSTPRTPRRRRQ